MSQKSASDNPEPGTRNPKPALLVFDIGGVLIRIVHSWSQVFERVGLPRHELFDDPKLAAKVVEFAMAFETGLIDEAEYVARTVALTGFDADKVLRAMRGILIEPYPGVHDLLHEVTERNHIRTACLSNTNATHWAMMIGPSDVAVPVEKLHHRFTSFEIGAMKPSEQVYKHVEKATGVEPSRILFFEDMPANIEGARRRGWQVCPIDNQGDTALQMRRYLQEIGLL
ncbi:MAG: HAD-IA family hydrolase [Phycisphaeraceae bacterium]